MDSIYKLPLVLEPQPEGGYTITCPLLPELITEADSMAEVYKNAGDALAAIIEAYELCVRSYLRLNLEFVHLDRNLAYARLFIVNLCRIIVTNFALMNNVPCSAENQVPAYSCYSDLVYSI